MVREDPFVWSSSFILNPIFNHFGVFLLVDYVLILLVCLRLTLVSPNVFVLKESGQNLILNLVHNFPSSFVVL